MQKGFINGLKPIFIQRLALLIGICYLLNPLQQQMNTLLHAVSHGLTSPNYVMAHDLDSETNKSHGHYDHPADVVQHSHSLIDVIDAIFTASNESGKSEDSALIEIKIDKHITSYPLQLHKDQYLKPTFNFWMLISKSLEGHLEKLKKPPQFFHN